jgi:broad specificity phosphatase PhoE
MTILYLIRHGETDWNVERRWQGHADIPLNERGRQQATQIAQQLAGAGLAAIYSSDLQRALDTAKELSRTTGLPVHTDKRLREINQGEWQGLLAEEVQARHGEILRLSRLDPLDAAPPGGETVKQVRDRVIAAIEEIHRNHPHQRVAIVSHGFSLALVRVHYQGYPMSEVWNMIPKNDQWLELELNP